MKNTVQSKKIRHSAQVWQAIANTRDSTVGDKLFNELCASIGPYIKAPGVSNARSRILGSCTWEMVDESNDERLYRTPMSGIAQAAELSAIEDGAQFSVDEVGFVHLAEPLEKPPAAKFLYMITYQPASADKWFVHSLATTLNDTKIDLDVARVKAAELEAHTQNDIDVTWGNIRAPSTEANLNVETETYEKLCDTLEQHGHVLRALNQRGSLSRKELERVEGIGKDSFIQIPLL